jgi:hypothetical protein
MSNKALDYCLLLCGEQEVSFSVTIIKYSSIKSSLIKLMRSLPYFNSDIKPPLLVVDPERFNRPGEKTGRPLKIRNLVIGKAQVITIIQNV